MGKPYFKTTDSGTIFGFDSIQPSGTGLDVYAAREKSIILEHVQRGTGGLILGGISGIGKTHLAKDLIKSQQGLLEGGLFADDCDSGLKYLSHRIANRAPSFFVLDEGMTLSSPPLPSACAAQLYKLLNGGMPWVLLGGGMAYTGAEQTDAMASALGNNVVYQKNVFHISRMNNEQIVELLAMDDLRVEKALQTDTKLRDVLLKQVENIIDPFRIPMHIKQLFGVDVNTRTLHREWESTFLGACSTISHARDEYVELQLKQIATR